MDENEILSQLFDIASTLSATLDLDTLLKRIGSAAEQLTDAEASSIMLIDETGQNLYFKVATGEKGIVVKKMKIKIGEGIAGWIAQNKKSLIVNDVSKDPRFSGSFDKSSGFQTRSILGVPMMLGDELIGVAEVLNKKDAKEFTEADEKILQSLSSFASVSISNARMVEDQKNFFMYMIEILVQAIESYDPKLIGHTWRVAQITTAISRSLNITGTEYKNLHYAALLHDIGYIMSTKSVSIGQGVVSVQQQDTEKFHTIIGWETVRKINLLSGSAPIIRSHHENYDGTGYPDGLKGDQIPISANILHLAEYVDNLRISGMDESKIQELVKMNSGKRFNPVVVNTFLNEVLPLMETTV